MDRRDNKKLFSNNPFARNQARANNTLNGTPMPPPQTMDTTGKLVKLHDIVHIPTMALNTPVLIGEVVNMVEQTVIITGQPPRPPMVVVQIMLPVFVGPDGKMQFSYVVGEVPQPQAQENAGQQEEKPSDLVLDSETMPEDSKPS